MIVFFFMVSSLCYLVVCEEKYFLGFFLCFHSYVATYHTVVGIEIKDLLLINSILIVLRKIEQDRRRY